MGAGRKLGMVTVAVLTIALSGCGISGSGKSEQDKARDAITALVSAFNHHDYGAVCGLISAEQLAKVKRPGTSCEKAVSQAAPKGAAEITLRIDEVRVRGDNATVDATVSRTGGAGRAETILMVKEGGDWKFAQVGF
jgi:hypothetical protein